MNFKVEKIANMVMISSEDIVWKAWMEDEFTERKLNNMINKIMKDTNGNATFERKF